MSLLEKITDRRIAKQSSLAVQVLSVAERQEDGHCSVDIGRTPFSMSTLEHMKIVSRNVIEGLGAAGIKGEYVFKEEESILASTTTVAGLTGYMHGPKSRPTLVFDVK